MKTELEYIKPMDIEKRSMEIIGSRIKDAHVPENAMDILKRVIHTSADFDYVQNLVISENAVEAAVDAIKQGVCIVTDTNMALSGINKRSLRESGGEACCFISDDDVAAEAAERGVTRATVAMEKACKLDKEVIFAVGNAPTALFSVGELIENKKIIPKLIIGVPVGFVNVVESKKYIADLCERYGIPYIVAHGNKGGSNIAAAICNALLYKNYRK